MQVEFYPCDVWSHPEPTNWMRVAWSNLSREEQDSWFPHRSYADRTIAELELHGDTQSEINYDLVKKQLLESRLPVRQHNWSGKIKRKEWWRWLAMLQLPKCGCGVVHSWLGMALVYPPLGSPRHEFQVLLDGTVKDSIKHISMCLPWCSECAPRRARNLHADMNYTSLLLTLNPTRAIQGKQMCTCMACMG